MRTKKSLIWIELWLIYSIWTYTQIDWKTKTIEERIEQIENCIIKNTIQYDQIKYWITEKYSQWFKRMIDWKYSYLDKMWEIKELSNNIIILIEKFEDNNFNILIYHIK